MKALAIISLTALFGSCGGICNEKNSCSSESSDSKEEETIHEKETKDGGAKKQWNFLQLEDAKTSCLIEDYSVDRNNIRYCQCKIEIISNSWSHDRYRRYPFIITRGLENSNTLQQCIDYATIDDVDMPEIEKDVEEFITDDIKEEESNNSLNADENSNESSNK